MPCGAICPGPCSGCPLAGLRG
ncbi:hypothetical protein phiHau3_3.1 [Streptomyces phage phiHau3]|uniref:Uncharacterized protein n=1 Tax=Streptomyces phage phiHau3 TaxID=1204524 RepID=K4I2C0_9CAUD|nr:hypothetical protein phiHau3_3.1 [Streptomyces phage phiHau3]AFU61985.1 hypothetical protein phiHau3_3.1 [Streptomyces phage phiHau3]